MFLIGLTGGIAAGKSTVSDIWAGLGATIIDSDELAREVVAPGTGGLRQIVAQFGPSVLTAEGVLDRASLGRIVFASPQQRQLLEQIIHPLIKARAISAINACPEQAMVVYNIPLLVETGSDLPFDCVVTVEASPKTQLSRLMTHRGLSEQEARQRISAQASSAERRTRADFVLEADASRDHVEQEARDLYRRLLELKAAKEVA